MRTYCEDCIYCKDKEFELTVYQKRIFIIGRCFRHPPVFLGSTTSLEEHGELWRNPIVTKDSFCGDGEQDESSK
jgi:hypothetical protein